MHFLKLAPVLLKTTNVFPRILNFSVSLNPIHIRNITRKTSNYFPHITTVLRQNESDSESDTEESTLINEDFVDLIQEQPISVKEILFPKTKDSLLLKLNNSASVNEVFQFLSKNDHFLKASHYAQSILVLWDLEKLYYYVHVANAFELDLNKKSGLGAEYVKHLYMRNEFKNLLLKLRDNCDNYDLETLACLVLYLSKMGVDLKQEDMQVLIKSFVEKAKKVDVSVSAISRFLVGVFKDFNISSYFLVQDLLPKIYGSIDKCETSEEFKQLTICLNVLSQIVTNGTLTLYKNKLRNLIDKKTITGTDYRCLLKILLFLNNSDWREECTPFLIECLFLLKDRFNTFNVSELLVAYEIIHKIYEPSEILYIIQKTAIKLLRQLEEDSSPLMEARLKLLTASACFSSAINRTSLKKAIVNYLTYRLSGPNLALLGRIIFFTKSSDETICNMFWDKLTKALVTDPTFRETNLLKLSSFYLTFHNEINGYRNFNFENRMNSWLEDLVNEEFLILFPKVLCSIGTFIIVFGRNEYVLSKILDKLQESQEQLRHIDIFSLAKSLKITRDLKYQNFNFYYQKIENLIINTLSRKNFNLKQNELNLFIKSWIYLEKTENNEIFENVCKELKIEGHLTSKSIKNYYFSLYSTDILMPDILDEMAGYVVKNQERILGFNAQKVINLCYFLGYTPQNSKAFFKVITDIMLRDQERLSGLSYLQSCLALCFFQKLPDSFIKQVFNVYFLEKLDAELANCYYKDIYPYRVRHTMMQLNRAVCLDYPEFNVPWFHQKYIEESRKSIHKDKQELYFIQGVKTYLLKLLPNDCIEQYVGTSYGYLIDFVLKNLNGSNLKIAVLLLKPGSYTKCHVNLKGQYQLKIRHLEILGYKIIPVNYFDWTSLPTGEEKLKFLMNAIAPSIPNFDFCEVNR